MINTKFNKKSLNVLGCVPNLLNLLFEFAEESDYYRNFNILKNIPVNVGNEFIKLNHWNVEEFDCFDNEKTGMNIKSNFTLAVVGSKSKKIVFEYFKNKFSFRKEQYTNLIHPSTYMSRTVQIDYGVQIGQMNVIASNTKIGFAVNIKGACSIAHHCYIGDYVEINQGVDIGSHVSIGNGTLIGMSSSIRNYVKIGENTIIGMGSVVTKDIPPNCVAYGNPCKVIKYL